MFDDTFSLIQELREKAEGTDPDTVKLLNGAETILKKAIIKDNLGKHEGVAMLRAAIQRRLTAVNGLLQEQEDMTEKDRIKWFAQKRSWEFFLKFFEIANKNIEVINKDIKDRASQNGL